MDDERRLIARQRLLNAWAGFCFWCVSTAAVAGVLLLLLEWLRGG